jgi:hypothetical protein
VGFIVEPAATFKSRPPTGAAIPGAPTHNTEDKGSLPVRQIPSDPAEFAGDGSLRPGAGWPEFVQHFEFIMENLLPLLAPDLLVLNQSLFSIAARGPWKIYCWQH